MAVRLATRGSPLALAQAELVARALREADPDLEVAIVPIRTSGDRASAAEDGLSGEGPPSDRAGVVGDKSRFVKEIEDALLAGEADLAVHSAKDVPSELPEALEIVAVPERADPRDALCGVGSLEALPRGAQVGTSSLRRRAQLLSRRPDLCVSDLRGNVDTRLRRLESGEYDALVLAAAGLDRLDRAVGTPLAPEQMTPAPGQGCLLVEGRAGEEWTTWLAERVTHRASLSCLTAERALVGVLQATCRTPIGAHAALDGDVLTLSAFAGLPDGSAWVRDVLPGDPAEPAELGRAVARRLLAAGADDVLSAAERWAGQDPPAVERSSQPNSPATERWPRQDAP